MSKMYDTIAELCRSKGVTIGKMCSEIGLSRSTMSELNKGRTAELSSKTTKLVADYFGVSTDIVLGSSEKKETPTLTKKDERDIARDLEMIVARLEDGGDMMFDGDPMSDEARESIMAAMRLGLEAAKAKNKARFTPKKYRKE